MMMKKKILKMYLSQVLTAALTLLHLPMMASGHPCLSEAGLTSAICSRLIQHCSTSLGSKTAACQVFILIGYECIFFQNWHNSDEMTNSTARFVPAMLMSSSNLCQTLSVIQTLRLTPIRMLGLTRSATYPITTSPSFLNNPLSCANGSLPSSLLLSSL